MGTGRGGLGIVGVKFVWTAALVCLWTTRLIGSRRVETGCFGCKAESTHAMMWVSVERIATITHVRRGVSVVASPKRLGQQWLNT
jgi:hypothetical protein